ncbi:MAG: TonB-dependent receptor [Pseudomonadales bacterium]|nr:TonB-dependent receptor [Pseudomonadales bacterium]
MQGSQVGGRADWVSGRERITLQTDVSLIEKSYNHSVDPRIEEVGDDFDNLGFNLLTRWQQPWNEHELKWQFALDRVERNEPGYEYRLDTYDFDFQFNYAESKQHRLTWGANVRFYRDKLEESNVLTMQDNANSWHLYSAFIQDEYRATDKLTLVAGLKAEKNQDVDIDVAWQPTLRFNYKASDEVSYWGSASLATRIPARIENDATFRNEFPEHLKRETLGFLFLQALGGAQSLEDVLSNPQLLDALEAFSDRDDIFIVGEIVGLDQLKEEETLAFELGLRWHPSPNLFFDLTAYHYDYDNLRSLQFLDWAQTGEDAYLIQLTPINLAEAVSSGFEISTEFRYAQDLRFKFNASHLDFEVSGDNALSAAKFLEGVSPENQFSFRTYYDISDVYTLDFDLYYVDEILSGGEDVPTDYADLNLRFSWKASPQLDVSFVLFNLFHDHRYEYQETLIGPQRTEIDRSFFIQLDWQQ